MCQDNTLWRKKLTMETILYNGVFYTLDEAYQSCSAMAIKNGVIIALGSDEEILQLKSEETNLINLEECDLLYGATMQQKGVTKLVSVKLKDAIDLNKLYNKVVSS